MAGRTGAWGMVALAGLLTAVGGCGGERIDWSAPENFLLRERAEQAAEGGIEFEYLSLVDAPAGKLYAALADVEHYPDFVDGVTRVRLISGDAQRKVVDIAQRVIGRQTQATVEWRFDPAARRIDFKTLESDLSFNTGGYVITPSPDGKRSLVTTRFLSTERAGSTLPVGVLKSATREAFLAAARGVKKRAVELAGAG
jgi:ribosome-associated toxin RatA of RatAB toxin-antitoxin module